MGLDSMEVPMKIIGALCLVLSVVSAWAIWFPLRLWAYSQVPVCEYAGLIKLILLIVLGYLGGIAIPIMFLAFATICFIDK